ncbi:hypothetical protein [Peteryoungia algae]|jgi:hypothetical protein|uniref:Anti-sigma factor NepR domain-containing protein n=1 Tax=Peteryoungia algae TaxID=2919917 RepID=A0ABT0D3P6_9HYPH|nr:hypothetical protein [Rhizobium sp. SSM4.3]MCJ8240025.1 hypothetical protein [Rhizobium sp. SSM4.3]
MEKPKLTSIEARRDRTGGIVRDKLDVLMEDMRREAVPPHLVKLAIELQAALDEKQTSAETET